MRIFKRSVNEAIEMMGYDNLPLTDPNELELKVQAVAPVSYVNEVERVKVWKDRFYKVMAEKKKAAEKALDVEGMDEENKARFAHMDKKDKELNESLGKLSLNESDIQESDNAVVEVIINDEGVYPIPNFYSGTDEVEDKLKEIESKLLVDLPDRKENDEGTIGYFYFSKVDDVWYLVDAEARKDYNNLVKTEKEEFYRDVLKPNSALAEDYSPRKAIDKFLTKLAVVDFDNFEQLAYDLLSNMTDAQIDKFARDYGYTPGGLEGVLEEELNESRDPLEDDFKDLVVGKGVTFTGIDYFDAGIENDVEEVEWWESIKGKHGEITGAAILDGFEREKSRQESFEDCYWDITFDNGEEVEGISGLSLKLDEPFNDKGLYENTNKKLTEAIDFSGYQPWSGAVSTWEKIQEEGKEDQLKSIIEEMYPEGIDKQALNELLWLDKDFLYQLMGIKDDVVEEDK